MSIANLFFPRESTSAANISRAPSQRTCVESLDSGRSQQEETTPQAPPLRMATTLPLWSLHQPRTRCSNISPSALTNLSEEFHLNQPTQSCSTPYGQASIASLAVWHHIPLENFAQTPLKATCSTQEVLRTGNFITFFTNHTHLCVISLQYNMLGGELPNSVSNLVSQLQLLQHGARQSSTCLSITKRNFMHINVSFGIIKNKSGKTKQISNQKIWFHGTSTRKFYLASVHIFTCFHMTHCIGNPSRSSFNHSYFFKKANTKDISVQRVNHASALSVIWRMLAQPLGEFPLASGRRDR